MIAPSERRQVLYEIAMSIGSSLDLRPMLKHVLSVFLRKMNCSSGGIYLLPVQEILGHPRDEHATFDLVQAYTIPRSIAGNAAFITALGYLPHFRNRRESDDFFRLLPLTSRGDARTTFHILALPNAGVLVLTKNGDGLDDITIRSLQPLMDKLASSSIACLQNAAVRQSEDRYRTIFENSGSAMLFIEEDMTISMMNREMERLSGYSKAEVEGRRKWTEFVADKAVLEQMKTYHALRRSDPAAAAPMYEFRGVSREGRIMDLMASVVMLPESRQSLAVLIDVTEKKRMERKLAQAQKMESIGTLAGGIAHDFSNILTSIKLFSHLIAATPKLPGEAAEYVGIIDANADQGKNVVTQLLTYAKPVSREFFCLSVNDVIAKTRMLISRLIPKTVVIHEVLEPGLAPINGDETKLEQVFMNLILNAKDAMPEAGGSILLSTKKIALGKSALDIEAEVIPGEYIRVSCEDDGAGIPEELLPGIFESFVTTKETGTGLGLAIVYRLVKEHRGYVTVQSEVGKGTTFDIYLPVGRRRLMEG